MAIEKYVGQYVTAEDANEYIDGYTILNSCNLLQDAARKLSDIATACQELKEYLSSANLCIQGTSMEPMIEAYEKSTMDFANTISALADTLNATTQNILNKKQIQLNEEARAKDELQKSSSEEII